jgi:hypothetical protein
MIFTAQLFLRADELRELEDGETTWEYMGQDDRNLFIFKRNRDKVIKHLEIEANVLKFFFVDGSIMSLADEGQSCCENRYMHTSDNLPDYIGATFTDMGVKESHYLEDSSDDYHECVFVDIMTSKGSFVIETHNEHNGYYGGFSITMEDSQSANL